MVDTSRRPFDNSGTEDFTVVGFPNLRTASSPI